MKKIIWILLKVVVAFKTHYWEILKAYLKAFFGRDKFIESIYDGDLVHPSNNYAIFLIWQNGGVPWYVLNALDSLRANEVNVVLVSNKILSKSQLEILKKLSFKVMVRENYGLDFGGYKDGTQFLKKSLLKVNKLIYINDSVFYYKNGLSELIEKLLDKNYSVVSAFENWEFCYHLQSFCISVDNDIYNSDLFVKYWADFLCVNSRWWAIRKGEVGFSKILLKITKSVNVVFDSNELLSHLNRESIDELIGMSKYLCIANRLSPALAMDYGQVNKDYLVGEILKNVENASQIHTAGFFHMKYNCCPLLKRDLIYRTAFSPIEVEKNIRDLGYLEEIESVMLDMKRKGKYSYLVGWNRIKSMFGQM